MMMEMKTNYEAPLLYIEKASLEAGFAFSEGEASTEDLNEREDYELN